MIRNLISHSDPLLHQVMEKFDFAEPPMDPIELAHDLAQTMLHHNGLGLAANQIGLPYRAFAINANPIIVCFNPIIVDSTESKQSVLEEGCLSYPGLLVKVKRPVKIKVRYTEPNADIKTTFFEGLTARIFCHELAHLDGRTFIDDCSYIEKERVRKKLRHEARKHSRTLETRL